MTKLESSDFPSKLLVHCVMGIGRAGTAISLINSVLSLRHQQADKRVLSIFSIVRRLREQRKNCVQN